MPIYDTDDPNGFAFADDVILDEALYWLGGNVTYVPLTGDIQAYVTAATAGDTLVLASGVYNITSTITVNKQLNIIGQGNSGLVTAPITPSHGTLISSATAAVTAFQVTSDNVRIAHLSINLAGAGSSGVVTANDLSGLVFHNIDVIVTCTGLARGFTILGSNAVLRDLTFYITSTTGSASGAMIQNNAATTQAAVVDCFGVTGTVVGATGYAYALACLNTNNANTLTLNLSHSVCRVLAGTVNDVAVVSYSVTTNNAIVNCYLCTLDGADYDAYQSGTNQLNLGGSILVNNLTFGTVNYRTAMVAGIVESEGVIAGTTAVAANHTAGADDYTILVTCSVANITILLPAAASNTGRIYNIKKVDATAWTVIVDGNAAETIDGALTQVLAAQYDHITVQCDGTQWWVI